MAGEHEPSNQARDLTVLEVMFLEQCLADTSLHLLDRFAAGVFLFQIYARNRWSDIRFVKTLEFDILQLEGETGDTLRVGQRTSSKATVERSRLSLCRWWHQ